MGTADTQIDLRSKVELANTRLASLPLDDAVKRPYLETLLQVSQLQSELTLLRGRKFSEPKEAHTAVVNEILPVVDNFDRAKASLKAQADADDTILELYEGISADINTVFESFNMQMIPSVGAEFDYNLHEAVQQMPSEEHDADIVCQEFQSEYCSCVINRRYLSRQRWVGISES